ncbi:MAG: hypothetical protein WCK90_01485 [archaeon]
MSYLYSNPLREANLKKAAEYAAKQLPESARGENVDDLFKKEDLLLELTILGSVMGGHMQGFVDIHKYHTKEWREGMFRDESILAMPCAAVIAGTLAADARREGWKVHLESEGPEFRKRIDDFVMQMQTSNGLALEALSNIAENRKIKMGVNVVNTYNPIFKITKGDREGSIHQIIFDVQMGAIFMDKPVCMNPRERFDYGNVGICISEEGGMRESGAKFNPIFLTCEPSARYLLGNVRQLFSDCPDSPGGPGCMGLNS